MRTERSQERDGQEQTRADDALDLDRKVRAKVNGRKRRSRYVRRWTITSVARALTSGSKKRPISARKPRPPRNVPSGY